MVLLKSQLGDLLFPVHLVRTLQLLSCHLSPAKNALSGQCIFQWDFPASLMFQRGRAMSRGSRKLPDVTFHMAQREEETAPLLEAAKSFLSDQGHVLVWTSPSASCLRDR